MKTLLTVTSLTLISNMAFAYDFYEGFASSEVDTTFTLSQPSAPAATMSSADGVPFYAFEPADATAGSGMDTRSNRMHSAPVQPTSYDMFINGTPDAPPITTTGGAQY